MRLEIQTALSEYGRASDLSLDWLISSWGQVGLDKKIALLYYEKARQERTKLAKRLLEVTKTWQK